MSDVAPAEDWVVDQSAALPRRPVISSFGPTEVEVAESCALRFAYQRDSRFPKRSGIRALLGTALHAAIEGLADPQFPYGEALKERFEFLEQAFDTALTKAKGRSQSYRDYSGPIDDQEIARFKRSLVVLARKPAPIDALEFREVSSTQSGNDGAIPSGSLVEYPIQDSQSALRGRVDRIERTPIGTIIIDYKATDRDDLPERYSNQVKIYAALWAVNTDEWPVYAEVQYLLSRKVFRVEIDHLECMSLLDRFRAMPQRFAGDLPMADLATPGETCKVCDYRPWCLAFWRMRDQQDRSSGLIAGDANLGLEGFVRRIERSEGITRIVISWAGKTASVIIDDHMCPHSNQATLGSHIRVLNARISGQSSQPTAILLEQSELFIVRP